MSKRVLANPNHRTATVKVTAATLCKYPDLMTVRNIQDMLHIGRSKAYAMLQNGEIKSIRIGSEYRIPKAFILDYLNSTACH